MINTPGHVLSLGVVPMQAVRPDFNCGLPTHIFFISGFQSAFDLPQRWFLQSDVIDFIPIDVE